MDFDQDSFLCDYDERCLLIFGIIYGNEGDNGRCIQL